MNVARELLPLAASLAIGLLLGVERGWHLRHKAPGTRAAGVRTFALIALLGGVVGHFTRDLGPALAVVAFGALASLLTVSYLTRAKSPERRSATTEVAALLTFVLGMGPPLGHGMVAGAAAVTAALLLGGKRRIHGAVAGLEERELYAALQLLAIVFLLLPALPDEGLGPWQAVNPRSIAWMVVLLSGLSFVAYVAIRRAGPRLGLALSAGLGGLVSSTAVTLDFARRARETPRSAPLLAAGIVGAGGTMFARILCVVALLSRDLLTEIWLPLSLAALACWGLALVGWRRARHAQVSERASDAARMQNPLALGLAVKFALLLAVVSVLSAALRAWLGDGGVYLASAIAGLGDVDAITLTLARQHDAGLAASIAGHGVLIAAAVDTLLKSALAWGIGGRPLGLAVTLGHGLAMLLGAAVVVLA
jgi:uncharacterized membrane protein (DUF4010 family)